MNSDRESRDVPVSRRDGLYFVLIGALIFIALGWVMTHGEKEAMHDFRTAYYCGKALLEGGDPYSEAELEKLYSREAPPPAAPDSGRIVVTKNPYLPSTFGIDLLFALFPERLALALWTLLIAASFLLASFAIWKICAPAAALPAGVLAGLCLSTSASLFYFANPAGFVVPLCILGSLSFLSGRFVPLGVMCFAVSLAIKPQDGAPILLYFLIAGRAYRKRALQTLVVVAALTLPAILWLQAVAPHWLRELSSNMAAFSGPGHVNDPRAPHGTLMMTNVQTATSFFWSDPKIYNIAAYLIVAPLLLLWTWLAARARVTPLNTWLALASMSALSMLPVYHRQYDAKLLLLQIPAFSLLWADRNRLRRAALVITSLALFLAGDLPWLFLLKLATRLRNAGSPASALGAEVLSNFTMPLALLLAGSFYLWVFLVETRRTGTATLARNRSFASSFKRPYGDLDHSILSTKALD